MCMQKLTLKPVIRPLSSIAAIYRGIGIGFALNPAKWKGAYKDYELNFNYFSSRLSLRLSYQRSESLQGDMFLDKCS